MTTKFLLCIINTIRNNNQRRLRKDTILKNGFAESCRMVQDNMKFLKLSLFKLLSENCSKKDGVLLVRIAGVCWHTESLQVV